MNVVHHPAMQLDTKFSACHTVKCIEYINIEAVNYE